MAHTLEKVHHIAKVVLEYMIHPCSKGGIYLFLALVWIWIHADNLRFFPWQVSRIGIPYFWVAVVPVSTLVFHAVCPTIPGWCIVVLSLITGWVLYIRITIHFFYAHFGVKVDGTGVVYYMLSYVLMLIACVAFRYLIRPKPGDRKNGLFACLRKRLQQELTSQ